MGKDKTNRGGACASSSRAAAGGFGGNVFAGVGFGGFSGATALNETNLDVTLNAHGAEPDPVIANLLLTINKQNQTTKRKGLRDLARVLQGGAVGTGDDASARYKRSPEEIAAFFPQWIVSFGKLVDDDSFATRQCATALNSIFVINSGKLLAKNLGKIVPAWFAACHDEDESVSKTARDAFELVFSTNEKRLAVVTRFGDEIVKRIKDRLGGFDVSSDETVSSGTSRQNESGTSEEKRERKERRVASAWRALGGFAFDSTNEPDGLSSETLGLVNDALQSLPGDGICASAKSSSPKVRSAVYKCVLQIVNSTGGGVDVDGTGIPSAELANNQSQKLKRVSLFSALEEKDGSCLGDARELTLGFVEKHGRGAWENTLFPNGDDVDNGGNSETVVDGFLQRLSEHVASGCHSAAAVSAPSVLPLLAGLPPTSLAQQAVGEVSQGYSSRAVSQENSSTRLANLLTSTWDGYCVCNVPSRASDAKALLNAFKEAFLFGAIVVGEALGDEKEKKSFRDAIFSTALTERWAPEIFRTTSSEGDDSYVMTSLCETLVGVSRRLVLNDGLQIVMTKMSLDASAMLGHEGSEKGVCPIGAARVKSFHLNLVAAATNRDFSERKTNNAVGASNGTAVSWVRTRFATPVARRAMKLLAKKPTTPGADLLSSFVETLGVAVLADDADNTGSSDSSTKGGTGSLLSACFATNTDTETLQARAHTLAAVCKASPCEWQNALRRAKALEDDFRDSSGVALVAATLAILGGMDSTRRFTKSSVNTGSTTTSSTTTVTSPWSSPFLDALVVSVVGVGDKHVGVDRASLIAAAAATRSVSSTAATQVLRNLSKAVSCSGNTIESFTACLAWAWPPPVADATADAKEDTTAADAADANKTDAETAWLELIGALWRARLDEALAVGFVEDVWETETEEDDFDDSDSDVDDDDDDASSQTSSDASSGLGTAGAGGRARSVSPDSSTHPASNAWSKLERVVSENAIPHERANAERLELAARRVVLDETCTRLAVLTSPRAARRLAVATATALAAFGSVTFTAAWETSRAALRSLAPGAENNESEMSEPLAQFLGETAAVHGSWEFVCGVGANGSETETEARFGTIVASLLRTSVRATLARELCFMRNDFFVAALVVLINAAIDDGIGFADWFEDAPEGSGGPKNPEKNESRLDAATHALRVLRGYASHEKANAGKRVAQIFDQAVAPWTERLNDFGTALDARKVRVLSTLTPLLRGDGAAQTAYHASSAQTEFTNACAKRAGFLLSKGSDGSVGKQVGAGDALVGPVVALLASCYGNFARDDSGDGKTLVPKPNGNAIGQEPLLHCFQLLTRKETSSAAAEAVARRFAQMEASTPVTDTNARVSTATSASATTENVLSREIENDEHETVAEEKSVAIGLLTLAVVNSTCAFALDQRDWERVAVRLTSLMNRRVAWGEEMTERAAAGNDTCDTESSNVAAAGVVTSTHETQNVPTKYPATEPSKATGWRSAFVAVKLLAAFERLPVVVASPSFDKHETGDVVPFGVAGADAQSLAQHLARVEWPSLRTEVNAHAARVLMAAGAELFHAHRGTDGTDCSAKNTRRNKWAFARAAERPLWRELASLWSAKSSWSSVLAVASGKPWTAMDNWEEARCGAVAALYEGLLCADESDESDDEVDAEEDAEDAEDAEVDAEEGAIAQTSVAKTSAVAQTLAAIRTAAYALLSSPGLVKPAVVGLDASVEDTDAVETAVLAGDGDGDGDGDAGDGDGEVGDGDANSASSPAERAAIREPLALKLSARADAAQNSGLGSIPAKPVVFVAKGRGRRGQGKTTQTLTRSHKPNALTSTLLCYGLLLRHLQNLPLRSKSRDRLAEFAASVKAVNTVMRLALVAMPLPVDLTFDGPISSSKHLNAFSKHSKATSRLPRAWQDVVDLSLGEARDGTGGAGAASAAANADCLSAAFLFGDSWYGERSTKSGDRKKKTHPSASNQRLAIGVYRACLSCLPAATRTWFSDCRDASLKKTLEQLTAHALSPAILEHEFTVVERASEGTYSGFSFGEHHADSTGELTVRVLRGTREISATYALDDAAVELKVTLPKAYPLVQAELTTGQRAGVSEQRARKWTLAVGAILRHQNGAVASGLAQWRRNVDREFAGVEPCPICYLVIHGSNHQLPKLRCTQCHNKFHNACLYKWFTSSSKSTCPLCQTPWGASYRA